MRKNWPKYASISVCGGKLGLEVGASVQDKWPASKCKWQAASSKQQLARNGSIWACCSCSFHKTQSTVSDVNCCPMLSTTKANNWS